MGNKSHDVETDLQHEQFDEFLGELSLEELLGEPNLSEPFEKMVNRRHRSARRRIEDLEQERILRDQLDDWNFDNWSEYHDLEDTDLH